MKSIKLSAHGLKGVKQGRRQFYEREVDCSVRSYLPGEWVLVEGEKEFFLGHVNPNSNKGIKLSLCQKLTDHNLSESNEVEIGKSHILDSLDRAVLLRRSFKNLSEGCRLVYGFEDELPGLTVDEYQNCILIQISSAGMDRFRVEIKQKLGELCEKKIYFLDNENYRSEEGLPRHEVDPLPESILVVENGIKYIIESRLMQKIGHYYDHRCNRNKMRQWLENSPQSFRRGLDLFCYMGSWGLNAAMSGVPEMDFVDQGPFGEHVERNFVANNLTTKRTFYHNNAFDFLKACQTLYDIIICDPPAFAKSESKKDQAISGYRKLYQNIFPLLEKGGLLVAASCTHYISLDELDHLVGECALKAKRKLQILDIGMQANDHPVSGLRSKANYIKFLLYRAS